MNAFLTAYGLIGFVFAVVSDALFPWENRHGKPETPRRRMVGAIAQGGMWPLALLAWAWMGFELRSDRKATRT